MNEEYVRELLRSQSHREEQNRALQTQQQLQQYNSSLQQSGRGLGIPLSPPLTAMLPRGHSSVGAHGASSSASAPAGQSVLDFFTTTRRTSDFSSPAVDSNLFDPAMLSSTMGESGRVVAATAESGPLLSRLAISQEIERLRELERQIVTNSAPRRASNPIAFAPQRAQALTSQVNTPNSAILQQYLLEKAQAPQLPSINPNPTPLYTSFSSTSSPIRISANATNQAVLEYQLQEEARILMRRQSLPTTFAAAAAAKSPSPFPSVHPPASSQVEGSRKMRGGVIEPFPEKLHRLLLEVELSGRSDVISFVSEGRAFAIHNSEVFFREIVPLYFRQSRLSSFKRQLNLYGFELINTGPSRGAYYHELFQRDNPKLCRRMRRVAVKVAAPKPASIAESRRYKDDEHHTAEEGSSSEGEEAVEKIIKANSANKEQEEDATEK